MTMITPSYLGETIEYSSLHACRSTLEDPTSPETARPRFLGRRMRLYSPNFAALRSGPNAVAIAASKNTVTAVPAMAAA